MNRIPASDLYRLGGLFKEIELCVVLITNIELYTLITNLVFSIGDYSDVRIEDGIGKESLFLSLYTDLNDSAEAFPEQIVNSQLLSNLKNEIKLIEEYLMNDLSAKILAIPRSEHINIQHLIKEPWNLFSNIHILSNIPESIKEDLILFCQCYAYGIYTSAIIHILKATENYNIHFYEKISQEVLDETIYWGKLIRKTEMKLDQIDVNNPGFKKLKESLEDLKTNNRIEIIHKNKVVIDEASAYKIFEDCRIVISKMFYILKNRFEN